MRIQLIFLQEVVLLLAILRVSGGRHPTGCMGIQGDWPKTELMVNKEEKLHWKEVKEVKDRVQEL
ncbi:hypothetical protein LAZ67_5002529 [Cordylochernes scorpioides]|uniref:Uncharacterized protein n=1 Tax=Cordylochernes scorpioides TaxID=51811 RepID=A0ABY6KGG2_9ARAC|nr:hypothetical protein LAZ67_5002529 [Cordylochernes scorpioides]